MEKKYCEFFNIDEKYCPCIDESAINAGVSWQQTYPHEAFINLLKLTANMLDGKTKRSIWIHGAYGTGKSQCAYALERILSVPEAELREYWRKYRPFENQIPLLETLIGHKKRGILTAYKYASGMINTPQQLFLAVQESIKNALDSKKIGYKGERTLKESVISWLSDEAHKSFFDALLKKPKWLSTFAQSNSEEVVNALNKSGDITDLMNNIFMLAAEEGIVALNLTADSLRDWIKDVIDQNKISIVLIWDEFSDFFRQNKNSLGEFQKIVSICQEAPFYFVVVTHPITSLSTNDDSWKIVQQRFDKVEISLPDNIAFDLIAHAFDVKEAAKGNWAKMTDDLNGAITSAKKAVMSAANITDESVMRNILPLHPMAALVLKNIATAFQSNQRSMFDFIKTPKNLETKAFQWFIQNTGPLDERAFLTVDMLWDFFYDKGKDYLSPDIRLILDTFPQQSQLRNDEKIVLKTILILQAIDQRLGGTIGVLKPTDQNLSYAFEGDYAQYEQGCKNIAKGLVEKGVLIQTPLADGKKVYAAAVLAGDSAKIEKYKTEIRERQGSIEKLISEAQSELGQALNLPASLKMRYGLNADKGELPIVTIFDFQRKMDALKQKDVGWKFYAVLALAKTEEEAQQFRPQIQRLLSNPDYKNIIVIDALSTPLGIEEFERYVEFAAMSQYYQGNNGQQSRTNERKANEVLSRDWRARIHDGQFRICSANDPTGERANGAQAVHSILQSIVLTKYIYSVDFNKGLTETQLKLTQAKQVAKYGMMGGDPQGLIRGCEKIVLAKVWNKEQYWLDPSFNELGISVIKQDIEKTIKKSFDDSGRISMQAIVDLLTTKYGFPPSNLTAFILGFLLKEYKTEPFKSMNSEGHRDSMTPDKLSEMIANCWSNKPVPTYIVSLTDEERAFYDLAEEAWELDPTTCSSPVNTAGQILQQMRKLGYPVWCLEEVDTSGVYDLIKLFAELVQSSGDQAHDYANTIGSIALHRPNSAQKIKDLLTPENCLKGMSLYINSFEGGKLAELAKNIGAEDRILTDIKKKFEVEYSALWNDSTGNDEIQKLANEYELTQITNDLLNASAHSKESAFKFWRETLKFIGFSCDALCERKQNLEKILVVLKKICLAEEILPDNIALLLNGLKINFAELKGIINDPLTVFSEIYAPYLTGFNEQEKEEIRNIVSGENLFVVNLTTSNGKVKKAAEEFRKNQIKTQVFAIWSENTRGTKNPRDWSEKNRTPILSLLDYKDYSEAKAVFEILNNQIQSESQVKRAFEYLKNTNLFVLLNDQTYIDDCFRKKVLREYSELLPNISDMRSVLEETAISAYDWLEDPTVKRKIYEKAQAEYFAGGSDKVLSTIESMPPEQLKLWLKNLASKDISLGIKIIKNGDK